MPGLSCWKGFLKKHSRGLPHSLSPQLQSEKTRNTVALKAAALVCVSPGRRNISLDKAT